MYNDPPIHPLDARVPLNSVDLSCAHGTHAS